MKILLVNHTLGSYMGTETMVDLIHKNLQQEQHEIRQLTSTSMLYLYLQTRRYLRWADAVCFFNFPSTLGMFPSTSKPVIWFCYDIPEEYSRPWKEPIESLNRYLMRRPGRYVIVISKLQAERFEKVYNRTVDYILPLGVDWNFFHDGIRTPIDNTFKILQVGAVGKFRNQLDSLGAFEKFEKQVPNSELILVGPKINVGSGPQYWNWIKSRISNKVTMTGSISKEELKDFYFTSNVLLHPVSESTGTITLAEAMSTGIPVIVNKKYMLSDVVKRFGVVTDNYVEGLLEVYNNKQRYNLLGGEASEYVKDNLSIESYTKKVSGILKEVMNYDRTYKRWWMREIKEL